MRVALAIVTLVVAGALATEATMQPSAADRVALLAIFAGIALATAVAARAFPRLAARFRSLRTTVLLIAVAAVGVAAAAVALAAGLMFLSAHDLRLVAVALGLGVGLGVVLAVAISQPLASDLQAMRAAAERIGDGDLEARTGVERPDEVGEAARALDEMAGRLARAQHERHRAEEARQAFLTAVSHDLRTPLTALQAAVEALQDGVAPDPERYLATMGRDLESLNGLVEDLFLLARIDAGKLDLDLMPLDLADLAHDVVETMAPVAGKRRIRLQVEAPGRVRVRGGPRELSRVIRNLLDNAIRHAPQNSTIRVEVANGTDARVLVLDDGPGFSAGFRQRAFDQFSKADPARTRAAGGAGLGLAIAKGLVEAHGGAIWIESGPGGRVGFGLPALT